MEYVENHETMDLDPNFERKLEIIEAILNKYVLPKVNRGKKSEKGNKI